MERVRGNDQETAADSGYKAALQSRAVAVSDMSVAFRRAGHERVPLLRRADVRRVFILRQACRDGLSRTRAPPQGRLNPLRRRRRESVDSVAGRRFPAEEPGKFRITGGRARSGLLGQPRETRPPALANFARRSDFFGARRGLREASSALVVVRTNRVTAIPREVSRERGSAAERGRAGRPIVAGGRRFAADALPFVFCGRSRVSGSGNRRLRAFSRSFCPASLARNYR